MLKVFSTLNLINNGKTAKSKIGLFILAVCFFSPISLAYCNDYAVKVDAIKSTNPACLQIDGGKFCGGGLRIINTCPEKITLNNQVIPANSTSYPIYTNVLWNFSSEDDTQPWNFKGSYLEKEFEVNGTTSEIPEFGEIKNFFNIAFSRMNIIILELLKRFVFLATILLLAYLFDKAQKNTTPQTETTEKFTFTLEWFFNTLIGLFSIGVLLLGFVSVTGPINNVTFPGEMGAFPANLLGPLFDTGPILVLFPLLVIRATLGKYLNAFKYSNLTVTTVTILFVLSGFIKQFATFYNSRVYFDNLLVMVYNNINQTYDKNMTITQEVATTLTNTQNNESNIFKSVTLIKNNYVRAKDINTKVYYANMFDNNLRNSIVMIDNYPELKSNEIVTKYIETIVKSNEQLVSQKRTYNSIVREINTEFSSFPNGILAKMFGFEKKSYIENVSL